MRLIFLHNVAWQTKGELDLMVYLDPKHHWSHLDSLFDLQASNLRSLTALLKPEKECDLLKTSSIDMIIQAYQLIIFINLVYNEYIYTLFFGCLNCPLH